MKNSHVCCILLLQYDPFAEHRPQKIADREDEYKTRRMQMIISPERLDPFADGKFGLFPHARYDTVLHIIPLSWFFLFITKCGSCSTLRLQCSCLPPRLYAFPVVNPLLSFVFLKCNHLDKWYQVFWGGEVGGFGSLVCKEKKKLNNE